MRWLILSHILRKSKKELDSTTHVFKRTTFWLSTFSWKIKKTSTTLNHITNYKHHKNRLRVLINVRFFKNCISEMSNFGKVILFSPLEFQYRNRFQLMLVAFFAHKLWVIKYYSYAWLALWNRRQREALTHGSTKPNPMWLKKFNKLMIATKANAK